MNGSLYTQVPDTQNILRIQKALFSTRPRPKHKRQQRRHVMAPKVWFVLPSLIYKPDDYIQLGQVINDPRKPQERLAKPLPLPEALKPRESISKDLNLTKTDSGEAAVSVFAHIVNIVTADLSGSRSRAETLGRTAAVLETQYFEITEDPSYVDNTSKVQQVEQELKKLRTRGKTVYMITGIKIARLPGKATSESSDSSALAAKGEAVVDPQGAARVGAEVSSKKSAATTVAETPDDPYVVAYRLRRLRVSLRGRLKVDGDLEGADMHGVGWRSPDAASAADQGRDEDWEVDGVSADLNDFGSALPAKDKKLKAVDEEDGRPCLVIRAEG